jgi:carbon monoxide dehydrogenase subunit G
MARVRQASVVAAGLAALSATLPGAVSAETVRTEIFISADPPEVWSAVRDVFRVHERLVPGMVVSVTGAGDVRTVTFASGAVVKERIVTIDDTDRRLVYAAFGGRATHHMASMQVVAEGSGSRLVWITDFLPAELRPFIVRNMEEGGTIMKRTLEARSGT